VDAILKSLENEPNLFHVQAWRDYTDELKRRWDWTRAEFIKQESERLPSQVRSAEEADEPAEETDM
jgi:hypothetical protein